MEALPTSGDAPMSRRPHRTRRAHGAYRVHRAVPEGRAGVTLILDGAMPAHPGQFVMVWLPGIALGLCQITVSSCRQPFATNAATSISGTPCHWRSDERLSPMLSHSDPSSRRTRWHSQNLLPSSRRVGRAVRIQRIHQLVQVVVGWI